MDLHHSQISQFARKRYLNLETYRKSGIPVRTPVEFAELTPAGDSSAGVNFYVSTLANSGKVKRIRNNPRVRVAPCGMRGGLQGTWMDAEAQIADPAEAETGRQLLRKKYSPWMQLAEFFGRLRRKTRIILVIRLDWAS